METTTEIARIEQDETKAIIAKTFAADPFALDTQHEDSGEENNKGSGVPYVGFRGHKTKDKDGSLTKAGIQPLDFYLHSVVPIRLKPFGVHLLPGIATFQTVLDNRGQVTDALFAETEDSFDLGFREHVYAVVAVALGGGSFVPATLSLHSAQCAALKKSVQLLKGDARDPALWGKLYNGHASAKANFPGGRFRSELWVEEEKPKNDPKGEPYNLGKSRVYPTPADEVEALNAWMVSDLLRIKAVMAIHNLKVERVRQAALKNV